MAPKRGCLSEEELLRRVQSQACRDGAGADAFESLNRQELLQLAVADGLVTDLEVGRTQATDNITLKRYLHTMVTDSKLLASINAYVKQVSIIRNVGSMFINLFVLTALEEGWFNLATSQLWFDVPFNPLDDTLFDTTFIKYAFLPFKNGLPGDGDAHASRPPHPRLAQAWERYKPLLLPLYPPVDQLRKFRWDQPLNDIAREYMGAAKAHILTHLPSRLNVAVKHTLLTVLGGVEHVPVDVGRKCVRLPNVPGDGVLLADVYDALENGVAPKHNLPTPVVALITETRGCSGLDDATAPASVDTTDDEPKKARRARTTRRLSKLKAVTLGLLRRHAEMSVEAARRGAKGWSVVPLIKTNLSFAYIDERIVEDLLGAEKKARSCDQKGDGLTLLERTFGLHATAWNKASKDARRDHRKVSRGRPQKKRCGAASYPAGWKAASVMTDGVALCVVLSRPKAISVRPAAASASSAPEAKPGKDEPKHDRPNVEVAQFIDKFTAGNIHAIVEDPGRVNISQMTQLGKDGKHVSDQLSRRVYLARTLQNVYRRLELEKRQATAGLVAALDAMGEGFTTWRTPDLAAFVLMVQKAARVHSILVAAYIDDEWYARWRMLLWRRKRSVLMQYYNRVVGRVAKPNTPIVVATGDGGFAATGKGERSVPTSGARAELRRALRARLKVYDRHSNSAVPGRPGVHTFVPEQRTTMCCHKCGKVLQNVTVPETGYQLRGLKLCHNCGADPEKTDHWCKLERVPESVEVARGERVLGDDGVVVRGLRLCVVLKHDIEHAHRLLNRDVNAARNIWLILNAMLHGQQRPEHLVMKKPVRKAKTARPK